MQITELAIGEVKLIRPKRYADSRGYFVETWNRSRLADAGLATDFVQDNSSYSRERGTIRGLHFQRPPAAQAKLVRVLRGSVFDVAVDLRGSSGTYGRFVSAVLSAEGGEQLLVPVGFAHGFCTLEPDTEVAYKVSDFYDPQCDGGVAWDDPLIGIPWPLSGTRPVLSDKDSRLPTLQQIGAVF